MQGQVTIQKGDKEFFFHVNGLSEASVLTAASIESAKMADIEVIHNNWKRDVAGDEIPANKKQGLKTYINSPEWITDDDVVNSDAFDDDNPGHKPGAEYIIVLHVW